MKLKPIYNDSTNSIIYDYIVYMEQNDLPEFINIESLDLPHFIGKIQHQQQEIERLTNELEREKSKVKEYGTRMLKAIEKLNEWTIYETSNCTERIIDKAIKILERRR